MFLLRLPQAGVGHMCSTVVAPGALHHTKVPQHSAGRSRLSKLFLCRPENAFSLSSIWCFSPRADSPSRQTP